MTNFLAQRVQSGYKTRLLTVSCGLQPHNPNQEIYRETHDGAEIIQAITARSSADRTFVVYSLSYDAEAPGVLDQTKKDLNGIAKAILARGIPWAPEDEVKIGFHSRYFTVPYHQHGGFDISNVDVAVHAAQEVKWDFKTELNPGTSTKITTKMENYYERIISISCIMLNVSAIFNGTKEVTESSFKGLLFDSAYYAAHLLPYGLRNLVGLTDRIFHTRHTVEYFTPLSSDTRRLPPPGV